jgi:hypothetical protein
MGKGGNIPHPSRPVLGPTGGGAAAKRPERGVDYPPRIASRLKIEYRYTSVLPLGLLGLFWGEPYLYLLQFFVLDVSSVISERCVFTTYDL